MNPILIFSIALVLLFIAEIVYFRIAEHYGIVDKPNHRSSHTKITLRGGGIIFPIAFLIGQAFSDFNIPFFLIGLFLIAIISFIDDIFTISSKVRLVFQIIALLLAFKQFDIIGDHHFLLLAGTILVAIAIVNFFNFMDGINGITSLYDLVVVSSLAILSRHFNIIENSDHVFLPILAGLLVFSFFNVRTKAKAFAGDIGSVSMAFIIVVFLAVIIYQSGYWWLCAIINVFCIDAALTLIHRLIRKENIFDAHRTHLYQLLVNDRKVAPLKVAFSYAFTQLIISAFITYFVIADQLTIALWIAVCTTILLALVYEIIRINILKKSS